MIARGAHRGRTGTGAPRLKVPRAPSPLRRETYRTLRIAILRGDLAPGTRLVEARLAKQFDISRTPIREAIHTLELEGLVRPAGRRGVVVVGLDHDDVREIMELREVLETYAAGLAARRAAPKNLKAMETSLRRSAQSLAAGDIAGLLQWNSRFHDAMVGASGSRRLGEITSQLRDRVIGYRLLTLGIRGLPARSHQEHVAILDAIRRRDGEAAETLVRSHVRAKAAELLASLRSGGQSSIP